MKYDLILSKMQFNTSDKKLLMDFKNRYTKLKSSYNYLNIVLCNVTLILD